MNSIVVVARWYKYVAMIVMTVIAMPVCAQFENTTYDQRLGSGRQEKENRELFSVWNNDYAIQNASVAANYAQDMTVRRNWDAKSYRTWYKLTRGEGRFAAFSLYSSGAAADMLRYLLYHENDPAVKMIYLDDLMWLSDFRINHLQELNSIPKDNYGPPSKSTLADVKTWKAHFYYAERLNLPARGYSKEKAYQYFTDAMKEVRSQKSVAGTEVKPYLLGEYFDACRELYVADNDRYLEQFLQDFLECKNTCRRLYETANDIADTTKARNQFLQYFNEYYRIVDNFSKTGAGLPINIEKYYKAKFEEKKDDVEALNRAIALMLQFKCFPSADNPSIVEDYAKQVWQNHPQQATYYSAWAYALTIKRQADETMVASERDSLRNMMLDAFKAANDLAQSNEEKAEVSFQIAQALNQPIPDYLSTDKKEIDKWAQDIVGAISYYNTAAQLSPNRYNVASACYTEQVYLQLAATYNKIFKPNESHDLELLVSVVDNSEKALEYYNATMQEFATAQGKNIYEQDGVYLVNFKTYAEQNVPWLNDVSRVYTKLKEKWVNPKPTKTTKTTTTSTSRPADPEADPTHREYHNWLRKKLVEDQFWDPRATRTCPYCKRVFR